MYSIAASAIQPIIFGWTYGIRSSVFWARHESMAFIVFSLYIALYRQCAYVGWWGSVCFLKKKSVFQFINDLVVFGFHAYRVPLCLCAWNSIYSVFRIHFDDAIVRLSLYVRDAITFLPFIRTHTCTSAHIHRLFLTGWALLHDTHCHILVLFHSKNHFRIIGYRILHSHTISQER